MAKSKVRGGALKMQQKHDAVETDVRRVLTYTRTSAAGKRLKPAAARAPQNTTPAAAAVVPPPAPGRRACLCFCQQLPALTLALQNHT